MGSYMIYEIGMSAAPLRVAVVGIHAFARDHLNHLLQLHHEGVVRLEAAVAHQRERDEAWAAKLEGEGIRLVPDLDALLALPGPELVTLPVGIHLHLPFARTVLAAGKACFLEKPAAATLAEADALARSEAAAGKPLFIGFQDLFHPATWELKRRLVAGAIGRVRRITVSAVWARPAAYYARNRWAGRLVIDGAPVRDSPANNACAHYLALALFLAGSREGDSTWPLAVSGGLWRGQAIESFDTASLRYATDSGVEVVFNVTHLNDATWGPWIRIDGDAGSVVNDGLITDSVWTLPDGEVPVVGRMDARFRHVATVMRGGSAPVCTIAHAAAHCAAIELAHATLPIRDIPAAALAVRGEQTVCRGLADALAAAHRRGGVIDAIPA